MSADAVFAELVANVVRFDFARIAMYGLLDPSGADKSMLMRILATLQEADAGTSRLHRDWPRGRRRVTVSAGTSRPSRWRVHKLSILEYNVSAT